MINTIKTIWANLSNRQRVALVIVLQLILILGIFATIRFAMREKDHIDVIDTTNQTADMPSEVKNTYEEALWNIIKDNIAGVDRSVIKDAVVRDGSYKEQEIEGTSTIQSSFLIDIDSIEQTYRVVIDWDKSLDTISALIGCPMPALGETSKYPESFCQGTYLNSHSLALYVPYKVDSQHENAAPDIYIEGDEEEKTIDVILSTCNTETNRKKAQEYLESTQINLSEYKINYEVSKTNAVCE